MSTSTRLSLLARLKDLEDQASWREFFDTYWRLIYSVARKGGLTDSEAQDVVQETVIAIARRMPEFEYKPGRDSFKGWLLQITRWKIADQFRKRPPVDEAEEVRRTAFLERIPDPSGSNLESLWDEEWARHLLQTALKRLKKQVHPTHFEIFRRYVVGRQPVAEVARATGVAEAQVYLVKSRLSELFKKEIRRLEKALI